MKPDELERRMLEAARDYNEPPEPPREEMWVTISTSLPDGGSGLDRWRERRRSRRLPGWTPWAIGLAAATMTVGFGLGRIVGPQVEGPTEVAVESAAEGSGNSLPVRLAAADHLGEAEIMLTLFRSTDGSDDRVATARWARELLATTRLMLDSRAGQDPVMARLLEDLELVLVQIASSAEGPSHQKLIEEGIDERQLLSKLRSAASPVDMAL